VLELYGPDVKKSGSFAHSALMARRLVERGVRVVQIMHRGWDRRGSLPKRIRNQCMDTGSGDRGVDSGLKTTRTAGEHVGCLGRGVWAHRVFAGYVDSETNYGRDHHPRNFCMWMAGGGVKGGLSYGETDDFSYNVTEAPVHINELNATILHCMGIDSERLSVKFQGLDIRLTGVEPVHPVKAILA